MDYKDYNFHCGIERKLSHVKQFLQGIWGYQCQVKKHKAAVRTVLRQMAPASTNSFNQSTAWNNNFQPDIGPILAQCIYLVKWKGKMKIKEKIPFSFNISLLADTHTDTWRSRDLWSSKEPLTIQNAQFCLALLQLDIFKTMMRQRPTESKTSFWWNYSIFGPLHPLQSINATPTLFQTLETSSNLPSSKRPSEIVDFGWWWIPNNWRETDPFRELNLVLKTDKPVLFLFPFIWLALVRPNF